MIPIFSLSCIHLILNTYKQVPIIDSEVTLMLQIHYLDCYTSSVDALCQLLVSGDLLTRDKLKHVVFNVLGEGFVCLCKSYISMRWCTQVKYLMHALVSV